MEVQKLATYTYELLEKYKTRDFAQDLYTLKETVEEVEDAFHHLIDELTHTQQALRKHEQVILNAQRRNSMLKVVSVPSFENSSKPTTEVVEAKEVEERSEQEEQLKLQVQDAEASLQNLEKEMNSLRNELHEKREYIQLLEGKLDSAHQTNKTLREKVQQGACMIKRNGLTMESLKGLIEEYKNREEEYKKDVKQMKKKNQEMQEIIDSQKKEITAFNTFGLPTSALQSPAMPAMQLSKRISMPQLAMPYIRHRRSGESQSPSHCFKEKMDASLDSGCELSMAGIQSFLKMQETEQDHSSNSGGYRLIVNNTQHNCQLQKILEEEPNIEEQLEEHPSARYQLVDTSDNQCVVLQEDFFKYLAHSVMAVDSMPLKSLAKTILFLQPLARPFSF